MPPMRGARFREPHTHFSHMLNTSILKRSAKAEILEQEILSSFLIPELLGILT